MERYIFSINGFMEQYIFSLHGFLKQNIWSIHGFIEQYFLFKVSAEEGPEEVFTHVEAIFDEMLNTCKCQTLKVNSHPQLCYQNQVLLKYKIMLSRLAGSHK